MLGYEDQSTSYWAYRRLQAELNRYVTQHPPYPMPYNTSQDPPPTPGVQVQTFALARAATSTHSIPRGSRDLAVFPVGSSTLRIAVLANSEAPTESITYYLFAPDADVDPALLKTLRWAGAASHPIDGVRHVFRLVN